MNFLAHYHFDRRKQPGYNLGLIIPDLYRNFVRGQRIREQTLRELRHKFPETSIAHGALQHFESDRLFHKCDPFKLGEASLLNELRKFENGFERDFFIAHILYELILDHALILEYPFLAKHLYTDFEDVLSNELQLFLLAFASEQAADRFVQGFNHFLEHRYLEKYIEAESIVYGLGRICNKMNISPFSEDQKLFLTYLVTQFQPIIAKDISKLEKWLEFKN